MMSIGILCLCSFFPFKLFSQLQCDWTQRNSNQLLKTNLLNLPLKSFNLEYERGITSITTWGISSSYTHNRDLPLKDFIIKKTTDENAKKSIDELRGRNISVTPYMRFYFGDKKTFTKFYFSPYLRYANYAGNFPLYNKEQDDNTLAGELANLTDPDEISEFITINTALSIAQYIENYNIDPELMNRISYDIYTGTYSVKIPMKANFNTLSLGYAFGFQFNVLKNIFVDWKIIGNHYGIILGNGKNADKYNMSASFKGNIGESVESLNTTPLYKFNHNITNESVEIDMKGLNVGLSTSVSVGFKF